MKRINEIKSHLKVYLGDYKKRYKVRSLGIFGSYSRGDQTKGSDIDILVEFEEPIGLKFVDFADELEEELNTKVDLVTRSAIKPKLWKYIKKDVIYV
jgi:predicted nucleotidyltransferase